MTAAPSFAGRPHRCERPAIILLPRRDVGSSSLRFPAVLNRPGGRDVVLPLRAVLAHALLLESGRMHLVEQSVEKVRRLIAAEKAVVVDKPRELQHDLIPV